MNTSNCSFCNVTLAEEDIFCKECGYPERGSDDQRQAYDRVVITKSRRLKEANKKISNVKILLYVIAGLNFLVGLYMLFGVELYSEAIVFFISTGVYVACAFWVDTQPIMGIMAAFIFWILLQLSAVFIDPSTIFSGLLLKIIILVTFIKGISSAREARQIQNEPGGSAIIK